MQERKDTLLRGKDPAKSKQYWSAFEIRERSVRRFAGGGEACAPGGREPRLIARFASAPRAMEIGYRRGFEALKPRVPMRQRALMPSRLSAGHRRHGSTRRTKYAADSRLVSSRAGDHARRSSITSVALMLMMLTLALIGAYGFSRTTSRRLARARLRADRYNSQHFVARSALLEGTVILELNGLNCTAIQRFRDRCEVTRHFRLGTKSAVAN